MSLRIRALGSTFAVETGSEEQRRQVARLWSRCLADVEEEDPADLTVEVGDNGDDSARSLLTQVTTQAIAEAAGRQLMVHAAAVSDSRGRVLSFVGPSGSGKTTAAMLLSRDHGFGYVTDETLAVLNGQRVLAYPRPIAAADPEQGREVVQSPDDLALFSAPADLTLRRVTLLQRVADERVTTALAPVPLMEALLSLIPQVSALPALDRPLQLVCDVLEACGGLLRLTYSDLAGEEAEMLRALLDQDLKASDTWDALEVPEPIVVARNAGLRDARMRQGGVLDAVRVGDEALLLVENTPIRLAGIGLTIWEAAADAPTFDELVERVVAEHGPHPDAESLVREAVDSMVEAKVLGFGAPVTVSQFLASMAPQLPAASDDACCGGA